MRIAQGLYPETRNDSAGFYDVLLTCRRETHVDWHDMKRPLNTVERNDEHQWSLSLS